ncbi:MAG: hypothetical protein WBA93_22405 [Microcoleaceae cyanobacterium]
MMNRIRGNVFSTVARIELLPVAYSLLYLLFRLNHPEELTLSTIRASAHPFIDIL